MITKIVKHWKIYEVIRSGKRKLITQTPTATMKEFMNNADVKQIGGKTIYTRRY